MAVTAIGVVIVIAIVFVSGGLAGLSISLMNCVFPSPDSIPMAHANQNTGAVNRLSKRAVGFP